MEDKSHASSTEPKTSRELLSVTGDGSPRSVVQSLLKKTPPAPKGDGPKTFQFARSPLLDELQSFLPAIQRSNEELLSQPCEVLDALDIENIDDDSKIIEMDVVIGERGSDDESSSSEDLDELEDNDTPVLGPVTEDNLRIPSGARGGKRHGKNLISEVGNGSEDSEDDRSDGQLTVASSSSAER